MVMATMDMAMGMEDTVDMEDMGNLQFPFRYYISLICIYLWLK